MRKKLTIIMLLVTFVISVIPSGIANAASSAVWKETRDVKHSGGTASVKIVWTDLNSSRIRMEVVPAGGKIGATAALKDIVASANKEGVKAVAGINGTFFDAYTSSSFKQPWGTVQQYGENLHTMSSGTTLGFGSNNAFMMEHLELSIAGGINGDWDWPNSWYAWNINHFYNDPAAVMLFTADIGTSTPVHNFTSVTVDKGYVTKVQNGAVAIPAEGFVIVTAVKDILDKFSVGDFVEYKIIYKKKNINTGEVTDIDWNSRSALAVGPMLVKNGAVVVNAEKEGFTEGKITVGKGQRSFIGITADNKMAMCTVANVTVGQLAEIAKNMGLKEAMNLDGGASSGLYHNGSYVTAPGRNLSNAIVVTELAEAPIKVSLNNRELFFDADPFIKNGTTLVPMRAIMEALGATVTWDNNTKTITAKRGDTILIMKPDSPMATINGVETKMSMPLTSKEGRTFAPARFITENFGGTVSWAADTRTVKLDVDNSSPYDLYKKGKQYETEGNTDLALEQYLKAIGLDSSHLGSLRNIASIYSGKKDHNNAIIYYNKILEIEKDNQSAWHSLGWAYYSVGDLQNAEHAFSMYIELNPSNASGYYGMASVYSHYQLKNVEGAKKMYEEVLKHNPNESQRKVAEDYLKTN